MKSRITISLLLLIGILVSSCSSDDDGPTGPTISSGVFATWNLSIISDNGNLITSIPCTSDLEYTFNTNKTYSRTTFVSSGSSENCQESFTLNGNWEALEDDVLELTPSSDTFDTEVLEVSLIDNGTQLEVIRSPSLTEIYSKN